MRTTIDLPDELLRRAKAAATLRGLKFKDLIASCIERGLEVLDTPLHGFGHHRPLPEFVPRTGVPILSLPGARIEELLLREEQATRGHDRSP